MSARNGRSERVLIIGDSLTFPRATHGQVIADSWVSRLDYSKIYFHGIPEATSIEIENYSKTLKWYFGKGSFDLAMVQVGIVDCYPRPIPRKMNMIIRQFLPACVGAAITANYRTLLQLRAKPFVGIERFIVNIKGIHSSLREFCDGVLFLPIAPPCGKASFISEKAGLYRDKYNSKLIEAIEATDNNAARFTKELSNGISPSHMLDDGIHLNVEGHAFIASYINEFRSDEN